MSNLCCNLCQKLVYQTDSLGNSSFYGAKIIASGGYFSTELVDGLEYRFHLCESCLRGLMNKCEIPPEVFDVPDNEYISFEKENEWYQDKIWRENGGPLSKYKEGLCSEVTLTLK